jgi:hypothetical protein
MDELKKRLQEEVNRYKEINKYALNLTEQAAPPPPPPPPDEDPTAAGGLPPAPGADAGLPPAPGAGAGLPPAPGADAGAPPPPGGEGDTPPEEPPVDPAVDDSTEDIDVTELVNMTKNIKQELENSKTDNSGVIQKMDGVFNKLSELESKLAEMDNIISKIDELGSKIEGMREPSQVEQLEMRSLDSAPFNEKPQEFFAKKQEDMRKSGKNEYVLTKDDVQNYNKEDIKQSFNDRLDDEENNF